MSEAERRRIMFLNTVARLKLGYDTARIARKLQYPLDFVESVERALAKAGGRGTAADDAGADPDLT